MAKVLTDYTFRTRVGSKKYPWDEWFDGQIRMLDSEDFGQDAKLDSVSSTMRDAAKRKGLKARISVDKEAGTIVLQTVPDPDADKAESNGEAEKAKPAAKKGKKTSAAAK